jgi:hypothetical protein
LQVRPGGILCRTVRVRLGGNAVAGVDTVTAWFCQDKLSLWKNRGKTFRPTAHLRDRSPEQIADAIAAFARAALYPSEPR